MAPKRASTTVFTVAHANDQLEVAYALSEEKVLQETNCETPARDLKHAIQQRFPAAKIELVSLEGERYSIGKDNIPRQLEKHAAKRRRVENEAARREQAELKAERKAAKEEARRAEIDATAPLQVGTTSATPGVMELCSGPEDDAALDFLLDRHLRGDYGDLNKEEQRNQKSLVRKGTARFLMSAFTFKAKRVYVVTRFLYGVRRPEYGYTTALLRSEYWDMWL